MSDEEKPKTMNRLAAHGVSVEPYDGDTVKIKQLEWQERANGALVANTPFGGVYIFRLELEGRYIMAADFERFSAGHKSLEGLKSLAEQMWIVRVKECLECPT